MSGVPEIFSRTMLSRTSDRPLAPITIAPIPTAIRMMLAAMPPSRKNLLMLGSSL